MKKKKINKKDIPGYAYGASEVTGAVTNGLASVMPYTTSGLATVGTALGGMASGAAAGAAFGPWGAAVGGAIGLLGGSIGSGGSVDEQTGEITNPSGIAGLFGHSKGYLQRKSNRIKNSNLGRQMTDALRADYYNNSMAEYNPNTFAEGGIVPTTLGWVDDGEFGRNPDGTLFKVPDEGKPTDSNLMLLKERTQLWSPNLKNPNTGNYFSIDAENIAKKYKTNGTDKYAKTTKSLNDAQMHKELDDLLAVQESVKMKKNKTKGDLPAYEGGKSGKEELDAEINARKMARRSMDDYFIYRKKDGTFVMQDIDGKQYEIPEMMLPYILGDEHGYWFGTQTGVAPSAGKWNGSMNFAKQIFNSKNIAKLKNSATKVFGKNAKPANPTRVKPAASNAKPLGDDAKKLEAALEETKRVQDLNRAMMSLAWLRGRTPANNLAGTTTGRDVASLGLWNLPNASSAVDDVLIGEGVRSNWPYYLGLAGMIGGAGTFLTSEYAKNNPTPIDQAATMQLAAQMPVIVGQDETKTVTPTTATPVATTDAVVTEVPTKPDKTTKTGGKGKTKLKTTPKSFSESTPAKDVSPYARPLSERKINPFNVSTPSTRTELKTITTPKLNTDYKPSPIKRNGWSGWADTLGYVGQLAAPIANIIEGSKDVEPVDPVYMTPTFGRVSVDPRNALRQIRNTQGLTNYNANNLGGAGMAYSLQNALNTNASINDLYSNVYDKEIGLSQFNANIANDAARYNADARRAANESYAQNKAARQNMKMTGIGQLGQLSGQIPRDIKLNRTNAGLSKAMEKWLAQYMPTADVNDLFKTLNYGR